MRVHDSANGVGPYYECLDCDRRLRSAVENRLCPDCGSYLDDLTVTRE